ncbi:MAG TPA: hypothetical protein VFT45_03355 [Longimicrobium sp.]|nr:hypothetical protein [Longimicrobium sp.]
MDELSFCGDVVAPDGLGAVAPLLTQCSWPLEVWRSGFDGSDILRGGQEGVEFEMDAGQGAVKFFSGSIEAGPDTALRLLGELSDALRQAGLRHRIEIDAADGSRLGYLHHDWPRGE